MSFTCTRADVYESRQAFRISYVLYNKYNDGNLSLSSLLLVKIYFFSVKMLRKMRKIRSFIWLIRDFAARGKRYKILRAMDHRYRLFRTLRWMFRSRNAYFVALTFQVSTDRKRRWGWVRERERGKSEKTKRETERELEMEGKIEKDRT